MTIAGRRMSHAQPTLDAFAASSNGLSLEPHSAYQGTSIAFCTSALGTLPRSQQIQLALLQQLKAAGVETVEISRKSLPQTFREFKGLGRACRITGLQVIYHADDTLWNAGFISASLNTRLAEAAALGAQAIKLSLGHYPGKLAAGWPQLIKQFNRPAQPLVWLENDQTLGGGSLNPLQNCLNDAASMGFTLGMAFNMANWHWCGVDPLLAAKRLARYVRQLACLNLEHTCTALSSETASVACCQLHQLLPELSHVSTLTIEQPLNASAQHNDQLRCTNPLSDCMTEQIEYFRALTHRAELTSLRCAKAQ
ncbi:sugar phosphate isomerase/epimerase [Pseudomonas sp. MS19]|uniref:sugar phosphate isomerase/epimerase n=1 Tax=Pseudomonas sp. MS19 TaxID=2579939 RepID=UPI001561B6BC|nr:sugar phosphate isomerase/epimerase [Pseudomonas sp. MS19]NRH28976.1 sugar phosphate isomerase/epimerase [Pseudomonas sp. MS19]